MFGWVCRVVKGFNSRRGGNMMKGRWGGVLARSIRDLKVSFWLTRLKDARRKSVSQRYSQWRATCWLLLFRGKGSEVWAVPCRNEEASNNWEAGDGDDQLCILKTSFAWSSEPGLEGMRRQVGRSRLVMGKGWAKKETEEDRDTETVKATGRCYEEWKGEQEKTQRLRFLA